MFRGALSLSGLNLTDVILCRKIIAFSVTVLQKELKSLPQNAQFLGAFAKLRIFTFSFVMSVCPSVRSSVWNNFIHPGRIFMGFFIRVFENLSRIFKFHLDMTRITGTLHEVHYTFVIISHSVLLRMRNVLGKCNR
jgi:hypothetical protein